MFSDGMKGFSKSVGVAGLFIFVNIFVYVFSHFGNFCVRVKSICVLILRLPIVELLRVAVVRLGTFLFDAIEAAKTAVPVATPANVDVGARREGERSTPAEVGPKVDRCGTLVTFRPSDDVTHIRE